MYRPVSTFAEFSRCAAQLSIETTVLLFPADLGIDGMKPSDISSRVSVTRLSNYFVEIFQSM